MSGITHADAADGTFSATGATNWAKDHIVGDLAFTGVLDGSKQTHAAEHSTTAAITLTAAIVECTTDGDGDVDYCALPAGNDGQMVFVHVKSCGTINDQFAINATFTDGSTSFGFGRNPKGKGALLIYTTTATAGWCVVAVNDTINNRVANMSTADQSPAVTRTYVTGSALAAPPTGWKVGTMFRFTVTVSKTGAGTTAPIFDINFGTTGSATDTARVTLTGAVATGVVDTAMITITGVVRGPTTPGSATCIVTGTMQISNNASFTTGFKTQIINADSAGFDITSATFAGLCCTPGTSSVWTIHQVTAEALNT